MESNSDPPGAAGSATGFLVAGFLVAGPWAAGVSAETFSAAQAARTYTDWAMNDFMLLGFMCWSSLVIVGVEALSIREGSAAGEQW